jgi:hypothetical protein
MVSIYVESIDKQVFVSVVFALNGGLPACARA